MTDLADQGEAPAGGFHASRDTRLRTVHPLLWLLLAAGGLLALLQPGLVFLVETWSGPESWYAPVVALLAIVLFAREWRATPDEAPSAAWPGPALVLLGVLIAGMGAAAEVRHFSAYALLPVLAGLLVSALGWRQTLRFWPAFLLLALTLPLPGVLMWRSTIALQSLWLESGFVFSRAAALPAALEGARLVVGPVQIHATQAGPTLATILPVAALAVSAALFIGAPTRWRLALALGAVPLVLLLGAIRLGAIVLAAGAPSLTSWFVPLLLDDRLVLVAALAVVGAAALALTRLSRTPLAPSGRSPAGDARKVPRTSGALASSSLILIAAAALLHLSSVGTPPALDRDSLAVFPETLGSWRGSRQLIDAPTERTLAADEYFNAVFVREDAATSTSLLISWYDDQSQTGVHSPEICIPRDGWTIVENETIALSVEEAGVPLSVKRLVIQQGERRQLVYFWIEQAGRRFTSGLFAKSALLFDALTSGRRDGALVRLITPILPDESEAEASARLQTLLRPTLGALPRFSPRGG